MTTVTELIQQLQALPQSAEVQLLVDGVPIPLDGEAVFDNDNNCVFITAE